MSILSGKLGIDFDIILPQKSFQLSPKSSFSWMLRMQTKIPPGSTAKPGGWIYAASHKVGM